MPDFKINGVKVKSPSSVEYNLVPIVADENRLENATLTLRTVAHKHKAIWYYEDYILGSDLRKILGESWEKYVNNKDYKFSVSMPSYDGNELTFEAYFSEVKFKLELWNDNPDLRLYSGFSITWVEY